MKILIISESSAKLDSYSDFFTKNGFDTICYSWLLKALDNITEIKPDSVVINAIDYPRHWKTLVQYVKSVYENIKSIIIIVEPELDDDELKKIEALGVFQLQEDFIHTDEGATALAILDAGVPQSDNDFKVLDYIEDEDRQKHVFLEQSVEDFVKEFNASLALEQGLSTESQENTVQNEYSDYNENIETNNEEVINDSANVDIENNTNDEQFQEKSETDKENDDNEEVYFEEMSSEESIFEDESSFITESLDYSTWLSCPIAETGEIVSGAIENYEHPIITFKPNDSSKISLFSFGKKIESCTLTDDGYPSVITVQVQGFEENTIELCVVK